MGNWYKQALSINSFSERNALNAKIKAMASFSKIIRYFSRYVYQNAEDVKDKTGKMAQEKVISSYPKIKQYLEHISAKALDNYKEASEYCLLVDEEILRVIRDLRLEREKFTNEVLPKLTESRNK